MGGRALSASELARIAHVTPQTASAHLARLVAHQLLAVQAQGRGRYFRLASPRVAQMIESIMVVAIDGPKRYRPAAKIDDDMRLARTCYDHLAGRLGVALTDALVTRRCLHIDHEAGSLTEHGVQVLGDLGVDLAVREGSRRIYCRPCLDWSERRPHLAGHVGAALADACFEHGWISRQPQGRAIDITAKGRRMFRQHFGIELT
jgi:DNA-binding transcriptional ArsR family regulator